MRKLLRKLGVGRFLYKNIIQPAQSISMLLHDTDTDARMLHLHHIEKKRARSLHDTPATTMPPNHWGTCELIEIARKNLPPGAPVWDISGYMGTWSLLARSLMPQSPIVCAEPPTLTTPDLARPGHDSQNPQP